MQLNFKDCYILFYLNFANYAYCIQELRPINSSLDDKSFLTPSEKISFIKGNNLLFSFRVNSCSERVWCVGKH